MSHKLSRIIIVEDDVDFLRLAGKFLRDRGHEVVEARDPLALAPRLSEHAPDLIIMDIQMPLGGADLAQKMLENEPAFAGIPLLFCSSLPLQRMKELFPDKQNRRYIQKPVDFKEFERHVRDLLAAPRPPKGDR